MSSLKPSDYSQNLTTWAIRFSNQFHPVNFCTSELHARTSLLSLVGSKNMNLKLVIGSDTKQVFLVVVRENYILPTSTIMLK